MRRKKYQLKLAGRFTNDRVNCAPHYLFNVRVFDLFFSRIILLCSDRRCEVVSRMAKTTLPKVEIKECAKAELSFASLAGGDFDQS